MARRRQSEPPPGLTDDVARRAGSWRRRAMQRRRLAGWMRAELGAAVQGAQVAELPSPGHAEALEADADRFDRYADELERGVAGGA